MLSRSGNGMGRQRERQQDDYTPRVLGVPEIIGLVASIATLLDYTLQALSAINSKKGISRCNTVKLVKCRLENIDRACRNSLNSVAAGELADAVRASLKDLKETASNLEERFSSGGIKAIECRLVHGSFDSQIESLRKGLDDIEGALQLDPSISSCSQANALMSHGQASTSTPTPRVQNNFYVNNLTVNIPPNGQAPEYNNYPGIQFVAEAQYAQIAQAAPGIPYVAPHALTGYPRY